MASHGDQRRDERPRDIDARFPAVEPGEASALDSKREGYGDAGVAPGVEWFSSPILGADVLLSGERAAHIVDSHPGFLPARYREIAEALADPDEVRYQSPREAWDWGFYDPSLVFILRADESERESVVVIVVLPAIGAPWIVTAYATEQPPGGKTVHRRDAATE